MSSQTGKRDVIRLRTFADDVQHAQETKGVGASVVAEALLNEGPEKSQGVFHKLEKKSLNFKDTSTQATALDSDGIHFDEETVGQVADKAYEEQKTVRDAAKQVSPDVEIHQTDTVAAIASNPTIVQPKVTIPSVAPAATIPPKQPQVTIEPTNKFTIKAAETIDQIEAPTASIQEREDIHKVHEVSEGDMAGGQIVSDKKRDRFKLFPALVEATSNWFSETKDQIEESQREKHTVTKTESRAETIKAAAQEKTLAPDEDFDEVAKRLRQQKRIVSADAPLIVKPKQEVTASWTHTIGEKEPEPTHTDQNIIEPTPVEAEKIVTPAETPTATEVIAPVSAPAPVAETVTPEPVAAAAFTPPETFTAPVEVPTKPLGTGFSLPTISLPKLSGNSERLPSPLLAIVVVALAIVSGIGTSLYFFWQPNDSAIVPEASTNPLFTAQLQTNVNLSASHTETMQALMSAVNSNSDTLFMYLSHGDTGAVVPPHETMAFLAPQAPGAFTRSVTNVSFGSISNQPFIVLRVNNFDNAFSGILAWEQTMSADLSPLFGPVVTESFDPQARTDNQTRGAYFKDIVASNLSGRLLTNERGEDRILYVFVDRQTIIITVDRLQLTNILPLIR